MNWFARSLFAAVASLAAELACAAPATRVATDGSSGVYVLGSLHALHDRERDFTYEQLGAIIAAIHPDILVLEVTSKELADRSETRGRPEYPRIVWPYLAAQKAVAVAMEPDPPLYDELVAGSSEEMTDLKRRDPAKAAFLSRYRGSIDIMLQRHWTDAAKTQDGLTADLMRASAIVQAALAGTRFEEVQDRWDQHMVAGALAVVRAHPDKRILVLASYRNRHLFDEALRAEMPGRAVDLERWLKERPSAGR